MDFTWNKEHLDLKEKIIRFAKESLADDVIQQDKHLVFPLENWKKCAAFGIQGLAAPTKYGGQQDKVDILSAMLAMEGFGYGCKDNGLSFALNAQMWTVQLPIVQFGTEVQKNKIFASIGERRLDRCPCAY